MEKQILQKQGFISVLIFSLFVIASNLSAQDLSYNSGRDDVLKIGLFYSVDTNQSGDIKFSDETGYATEYDQTNFTAGLNLQVPFRKGLAFESGINYSDRNFSGTYYCFLCDFLVPPQKEEINLQFVQVPVALRAEYALNTIGFFGRAGLLNQFLVNESEGFQFEEPDYHSFSLSMSLGAGAEVYFGSGFSAALSINFTNGITPVFKNAEYSYQTLGVQLALAFAF